MRLKNFKVCVSSANVARVTPFGANLAARNTVSSLLLFSIHLS
jgi:hypothetical protein